VSVRAKPPRKYTFDFWWQYTLYCRRIAKKAGVRMRTLDKALWQYSKERQKGTPRIEEERRCAR